MTNRIQVVTATDQKLKDSYLISRLVTIWRQTGYEVIIGPTDHLDADIGILHIDQTWMRSEDLPSDLNGKQLLNGNVLDISKRRFSNLILDPHTSYAGQVIIKTNANCFGIPERKYQTWKQLHKWRQRLAKRFDWRWAHDLPGTYPVLDHPSAVPKWVWKRDDLIVEKFLPEMDGDLYVLRIWLFFGEREYGARIWSTNPIVKAQNLVRYEYINDVPEDLRIIRSRLGFDFGKFDYVIIDGKAILLDVNKTPTISTSTDTPSNNIHNLAQGIRSYI